MKTLAQACKPRDSIFDAARRDTVLDLSDLVSDRIDPEAFFRENRVTAGMRILLTEGFRLLEGKITQGVFKLTQAMGGGKNHKLLALGLLAKHPQFRRPVFLREVGGCVITRCYIMRQNRTMREVGKSKQRRPGELG